MKKSKFMLVGIIILIVGAILAIKFININQSKTIQKKPIEIDVQVNEPEVKTEKRSNIKYSKTIPETAKYKIYADILEFAPVINTDAYKTIYDAVDQLQESVDMSKYNLIDTEIDDLNIALFNRVNFELFYIKSIDYDKKTNSFKFKYTYNNDEILKMKQKFNSKVIEILDTCVDVNSTDLENELAIYKYIAENVRYNCEENPRIDKIDAYSIIVNGKGICMGYANALQYLFDLSGIQSRTVVSDEPFHLWNMVTIDNKDYHVDATWEDSLGNGLKCFNMTDAERNEKNQFPKKWYRGNLNYKKIELPICDDIRFKFMRNITNYDCANEQLYYVDQNDSKIHKINLDGKNLESVGISKANEMVVIDDWIYYSNKDDLSKLYKMKTDGSNDTKVLDTSVRELRRIEQNLQYSSIDTEGESEIHILELK